MILRAAILVFLACAACLFAPGAVPAGERTAIYPGVLGPEITPHILFETAFPLNELLPSKWSPAQLRDVSYFRERMKKDRRIFLIVQVSIDPIGRKEENADFALELSHAVAERLRESGIRQDRILIVPGIADEGLFERPRWDGFAAAQKVTMKGVQGGPWLMDREIAADEREELPPEGKLRILEPAVEKTEQARHVLSGSVEGDVRTVSISIGQETKTAAVYGGKFEVPISLRPGENRIVVTGLDPYGRALHASRTVLYAPPKPSIELGSPPRNAVVDVSRSPVINVHGRIESRTPLQAAYLIQNDTPIRIRFRRDGTFEQPAAMITDEDVFTVEAEDREGRTGVSEERRVTARGIAERPLMAILHWDEDDVDLDLHITDDRGRHTWYDAPSVLEHARAIPEGKLLLDNRAGFGPEVFTIDRIATGYYTFSVEYYRGKKPCRAYLTVVMFAGSPSRKCVRVFGPIVVSPAVKSVELVQVALPAGTIRELKH
ncbi:MAG: hypothetical protein HY896_09580 [Deltaproteobacteria bacterium]|nr:hypothetical protein [Deltaproteobacteria bacterium]